MNHLTFEITDEHTSHIFHYLMHHYGIKTPSKLVAKAISLLQIAATIDETEGELIARKGNHETRINLT